jgi:hypothetical protein
MDLLNVCDLHIGTIFYRVPIDDNSKIYKCEIVRKTPANPMTIAFFSVMYMMYLDDNVTVEFYTCGVTNLQYLRSRVEGGNEGKTWTDAAVAIDCDLEFCFKKNVPIRSEANNLKFV